MDYRHIAFILVVVAALSIRFGTIPLKGIGGVLSVTECGRNLDIIDYGIICGDEMSMNIKLTQGVFTTVPVTPQLQRARGIFWRNCEDKCIKNSFLATLNASQGEYLNLITATKDHALRDNSASAIPFSFSLGFVETTYHIPLYWSKDPTPAVFYQKRGSENTDGAALVRCVIVRHDPAHKTIHYACTSPIGHPKIAFAWIRKVGREGIAEQMAAEYSSYKMKIPPISCD
mgnify:CR=1 FL=1